MNKIKRKRLLWLGLIVVLLLVIILRDSSLLINTQEIRGGFSETAFKRNENNSGPVIRIYAVKVDSPTVANYDLYGNSMPHTEHGITKIFFFDGDKGSPTELQLNSPHFDTTRYEPIWVFQKNAVGAVTNE